MKRVLIFFALICFAFYGSACSKEDTPPAKSATSAPKKVDKKKTKEAKAATISPACKEEFNQACPAKMEKRWQCMKQNMKTFSPACMKEWMAQKGQNRNKANAENQE